jgi:aminoglycoside phosphotransferase (APT) family kinase protein
VSVLAAPPPTQDVGETQADLFAWVAGLYRGEITRCIQTAGGNRCQSWAIDVQADGKTHAVFLRYAPPRPVGVEPYTVHREAQVYRAIDGAGLRAPRLLAEHPQHQAVLTERAAGIAEFRHLSDPAMKQAIATEFMQTLASLHRVPVDGVVLDGGSFGPRIADHVRAELRIWRAMYDETGSADPVIDLAFGWLDANMPDPDGAVVLAHGDAGPGNFLFEHGHLTALIDWELAHLGDPMEDLAWYSMRCVMEPVPDFGSSLRAYERFAAAAIDRARVLYHRVFVSTRVLVIRHRNVTGEPAHALVSLALNRRLLIEALADAAGITLAATVPIEAPPTPQTPLYDHVLADLRDVVVARSTDGQVIAKAKNAAKIIKYLQAQDRYGAAIAAAEPDAPSAGASLAETLQYHAGRAARQAQLAATASGGIAHRHYPAL